LIVKATIHGERAPSTVIYQPSRQKHADRAEPQELARARGSQDEAGDPDDRGQRAVRHQPARITNSAVPKLSTHTAIEERQGQIGGCKRANQHDQQYEVVALTCRAPRDPADRELCVAFWSIGEPISGFATRQGDGKRPKPVGPAVSGFGSRQSVRLAHQYTEQLLGRGASYTD
jgi:hypothetical protein